MTKQYSITEARANFSAVVHEVEGGARVELTWRGKPVAVLLRLEEYARLAQGRRDFWEAYEEFRREYDLPELGIDPEEAFGGIRDARESELLAQIDQGLPGREARRYQELMERRRAETLTPGEHEELLQLTVAAEGIQAERIRLLIELAQLRGTTLDALMKDLGLRPSPNS